MCIYVDSMLKKTHPSCSLRGLGVAQYPTWFKLKLKWYIFQNPLADDPQFEKSRSSSVIPAFSPSEAVHVRVRPVEMDPPTSVWITSCRTRTSEPIKSLTRRSAGWQRRTINRRAAAVSISKHIKTWTQHNSAPRPSSPARDGIRCFQV